MERYLYEVVLTPDAEEIGVWNVSVPDLDGCFTCGDSFEEAIEMAVDALKTYVGALIKGGDPVPRATFGYAAGEGERVVVVSFETDASYILNAVDPCVAAEMLGVSRGRVSQLIRSGRLKSYQVGLFPMVDVESIEERLKNPPKAGRPRKLMPV
ncbi:MAG TPA: HicB family protein [Coriobacteriia bacterium]|nr:HicB family protein [Coriobacteriia bacterium]